MIDLQNFQPPDFIPPPQYAQNWGNIILHDKGYKPREMVQIQSFFDAFNFDDSIIWFNEPLIPKGSELWKPTVKEINQLRHSCFMRPDAIIYRPPGSVFIVEFTRKLTTRTLGQAIHYNLLYRHIFGFSYNLHTVAVFTVPVESLIQHLLALEYIPILEVPLELKEGFPPEYYLCHHKTGALDFKPTQPNLFKFYDDHFQHPKPLPNSVV